MAGGVRTRREMVLGGTNMLAVFSNACRQLRIMPPSCQNRKARLHTDA